MLIYLPQLLLHLIFETGQLNELCTRCFGYAGLAQQQAQRVRQSLQFCVGVAGFAQLHTAFSTGSEGPNSDPHSSQQGLYLEPLLSPQSRMLKNTAF